MPYALLLYVKDYRIEAAVPYLVTLLQEDKNNYRVRSALKALNTPTALFALEEWEKNQKGKA